MLKKKNIKLAALLLLLVLGLTACGTKEDSQANDGNDPSAPSQADADSGEKNSEDRMRLYNFVNENGEFSLTIPQIFMEAKTEEVNEEEGGGTKGRVYKFEAEEAFLEVSDLFYPEIEVNEDLIKEEVALGEGLVLQEIKTIDTKDNHLFVGAEVMDTSVGNNMSYYRSKVGDRIISIVLTRPLSSDYPWKEDVEKMIGTFSVKR